MMAERAHLSIGEVLGLLQGDFPDVTISKIRFLESQGLLDPERTPSGYRKFYEHDIAQLQWILTQQRDHFLPLKVIKTRLESGIRVEDDLARGLQASDGGADDTTIVEPTIVEPTNSLQTPERVSELEPSTPESTIGREVAETHPGPAPELGTARDSNGHVATDRDSQRSRPAKGSQNHPAARYHSQVADLAIDERYDATPSPTRDVEPSAPADTVAPPPAAQPDVPPLAHLRAVVSQSDEPGRHISASGPAGGDPWPAQRAPGKPRMFDRGISGINMSFEELSGATGVSADELTDLERFGLIEGRQVGPNMVYDEDSLVTCRIVANFLKHGLEVRHLRMYFLAAEREANFLQQMVSPILKQRNSAAQENALELLEELVGLGDGLRTALITRSLRSYLGNE